jgi:hypothetical protein
MRASGRVSSGGSSGRRAGVLFQVKYTNQAGALRSVPRESTTSGPEGLCSLWIGSSARRAFGGCLGSKRR